MAAEKVRKIVVDDLVHNPYFANEAFTIRTPTINNKGANAP